MAFQPTIFTIPSMVSGNSLTTGFPIPGNFLYMYLQVPTMTGGFAADTRIMIQGSYDGVTYYRYSNPETNTFVVGTNDFIIASGATQRMVLIPSFSFPFIKVETTAVATAGISSNTPFKVICVSNQ